MAAGSLTRPLVFHVGASLSHQIHAVMLRTAAEELLFEGPLVIPEIHLIRSPGKAQLVLVLPVPDRLLQVEALPL